MAKNGQKTAIYQSQILVISLYLERAERMKNDLLKINSLNFSVTVDSGTLEEKNSTAHRLYYLYDSKSTENGLKNLILATFWIGILCLVLSLIPIWNAVTYGIVLFCARKLDDYCLCTKGQLISECLFDVLNFPKNQQKI